jgi:hypothetical protein
MMRVPASVGRELVLGPPEMLFEILASFVSAALGRNFDVSADGQRFLMVQGTADPLPPQIVVVPDLRGEIRD